MMLEKHVNELLPGFALGCLDPAEEAQVAAHLEACPACAEELRAYQEVADQLPLALPVVEPPPRIKQALMARLQAAPADSRAPHPSSLAAPHTAPQATPQPKSSGWLQALWARLVPQSAWKLVPLALVMALALSNLLLWQQVNHLMTRAQPNQMRVINLQGSQFTPDATGLVVVSMDGEHGTLVVDHLPVLSESQQYQLWLIKDGQRTSGGVFSVSSEGYGALWVDSPQPLAGYDAFGITIEPAGGSPGPTGERVLGAEN